MAAKEFNHHSRSEREEFDDLKQKVIFAACLWQLPTASAMA